MQLVGVNFIVAEPFPDKTIKVDVVNGVAKVKQKHELVKLKVLRLSRFVLPGTTDLQEAEEGSFVYVNGECMVHKWAKDTYEVDGLSFVLVPPQFVVMAEIPE